MSKSIHQGGFTLVELMISLALGLVISGAVIQILVSNSVTDGLNRAIASTQENGRFIITRMRQELLPVGYYDLLNPNLNDLGGAIDLIQEESFLRTRPVILPNQFVAGAGVGSVQGANGANDTLVVGMQALRDCRGFKHGYPVDDEFYVVNEYFVQNGNLRCRGYDGRTLRGQRGATNSDAVTLLDNVLSFQVLYGVTAPLQSNVNNTGLPVRYIDASQLQVAYGVGAQVVTIRLAIVVEGEGEVNLDQPATFTLLNEAAITAPDNGLYRAFETTITLRNMKNFVRGRI